MLYGDKRLREQLMVEVKEYAKKNNMKIVFGAMVGSISKGLQYADSDYDTRFLFIREDFPDKINIPNMMKEEELVQRYYPKEPRRFEWIPFWELTSFLQFLDYPSFKDDFSVGLYNIVGWTFLSPYLWDPYGLQNKLLPLINSLFIKEYELMYHLKFMEKYLGEFHKEGKIIAKSYLYLLHSALTIDWCLRKNGHPPIYQSTLLSCCQPRLHTKAMQIIESAREESYANNKMDKKELALHHSHFTILTDRDNEMDEYINSIYLQGKKMLENFDISKVYTKNNKETINLMYQIIAESIKNMDERNMQE